MKEINTAALNIYTRNVPSCLLCVCGDPGKDRLRGGWKLGTGRGMLRVEELGG